MSKDFNNWKEQIDNNLDFVLDREINDNDNESVKYSLNELKRLSKGGKRIRGILIKIGQLLNGVNNDSYLSLATAFELFQTSVLIHDDIIDEADERRGMPTINKLVKGHHGISKAICIGDLGFFLSYRLINESSFDNNIKTKLLEIYTKTIYNTVIGEIIDLEIPLKSFDYHLKMEEKEIYDIYANKTSWYTFIGPLLLGAISTGLKDDQLTDIIDIGMNLGIAFQIKDDLLGLYSTNNEIGKTVNDIKENKQTIIYKYAISQASKEELDIINKYYGKDNNSKDNKQLLDLFIKLGAKDNAVSLVKDYTNKAIEIINKSNYKNKDYLINLALLLVERAK